MKRIVLLKRLHPVKSLPILLFSLLLFQISNSVFAANQPPVTDKNLDPVVLQLKWFHQFQAAGFYAALHKGFYKEKGLDVTIKSGGPHIQEDLEVSSGRANYGVLASELIEKKAQGQPLVILSVIMQHSMRVIIVRADSGINSPADLVGRSLMLNRNEDIEFTAMFTEEGLSLDQFNIITKDNTANEKFLNGEIDALNGSVGNQVYWFESRGVPVKTIRPISYGIDFYGNSLFTSEEELEKHPGRVEAFRVASLRGWEYAMSHTDEIIDLIIAEYDPTKTHKHLQFEADTIRKLILPDLIDLGHINPHRVANIAQIYAKNNLIPQNFSLEGFIYDPFSDPNAKLIKQLIAGFFIVVAVVLFFVGILVFFNMQLRKRILMRTTELSELNQNLSEEVSKRKHQETILKKSEKFLQESEEKFKAMAETSPLAIYMSTGIEQKAEYINPTFVRFFGYTMEDVPSVKKWWPLAYPNENYRKKIETEWQKRVERAIETKSDIEPMEAVVTCKDGSKKNISWRFISLGEQSWACGLDQTKQKQAESKLKHYSMKLELMVKERTDELKQTQKELLLKGKLAAIGKLSGSVAHDIRNPLGVISNSVYYLNVTQKESADEKLKTHIGIIKKEIDRANNIINDLMEFSKKNEPILEEGQINTIIEDLLEQAVIPENIVVRSVFGSHLPLLTFDSSQLRRVFQNLLANAIQSMPKGGLLHVSTQETGGYIEMAMQDTGSGISPEDIDNIYEPLFTTKSKGVGLGLSITKTFVNLHNGSIEVESVVGEGTTFTVRLPCMLERSLKDSVG